MCKLYFQAKKINGDKTKVEQDNQISEMGSNLVTVI